MISIRPETVDDHDAIDSITVDAFTNCEFGHNGEAELIRQLRSKCPEALSLVACEGDNLVGHILFTPATIRGADRQWNGMGLGPMSVLPTHQNRGIGSMLVSRGLAQVFADGSQFVVVLGHAGYYPRFGFNAAVDFGISHGFANIPQEFFFIVEADRASPEPIRNGAAYYDSAFGSQHLNQT